MFPAGFEPALSTSKGPQTAGPLGPAVLSFIGLDILVSTRT
jgi:hypothetical protein